VRQVHEVLGRERPTAYTTALKLLQIMTEKGLVRRDETDRTHVYQARWSEEQTQRQLVRDLLERAFGGSASKLVMQALAAKRASPEELGEIRKLIDGRHTDREVRDDRD
jgi:predicted transcriptional regulator